MEDTSRREPPQSPEEQRQQDRKLQAAVLRTRILHLLSEQTRLTEKRMALQKDVYAFLGKPEPQKKARHRESYSDCLAELAWLHERAFGDIEIADPRCLVIFEIAAVMEKLRKFTF